MTDLLDNVSDSHAGDKGPIPQMTDMFTDHIRII